MNRLKVHTPYGLSILMVFALIFSFLPAAVGAEEHHEVETKEKLEHQTVSIKEATEQSLEHAKTYYENNPPQYSENKGSHSDYWVFSALWGAGYKDLKNDFPWNDTNPWSEYTYWAMGKDEQTNMANEDIGIIIGSLLLGKDPYQFGTRNIVEDLLERQSDKGLFSTLWGESWALVALELIDAAYDKEQHIQAILEQQSPAGSFGDADATGWMMTALAPYMDENPNVASAMEKSVEWAYEQFVANDEFPGMFGPNANSTASVVMGLAAVGEDLYGEKWSKEKDSLIEDLIEYQQKDGSFWWQKDSPGAIGMATEQALLAMATVVEGQSIFIDLKDHVKDMEQEEDEEDPDQEQEEDEEDPDQEQEEEPSIKEVTLGEKVNVSKSKTMIIKGSNSQIELPDTLPDGTLLTVAIPDEKNAPYKDQQLELAGDWFDFNFDFTGSNSFKGTYELTLDVADNVDLDKAGVYLFNDKDNVWEYVEGVRNQEKRTITVEVDHFSIYGVFIEAEEDDKEDPEDEEENPEGNESDDNEDDRDTPKGDGGTGKDPGKSDVTIDEDNEEDEDADVSPKTEENDEDGLESNASDGQKEVGKELPETATHLYNFLAIGLFMLVLGGALLIIRQRKTRQNK